MSVEQHPSPSLDVIFSYTNSPKWLIQRKVVTYQVDGTKLREARVGANITLRQLAQKIGVSAPYLCDLEFNRRGASKETILKLCDALKEKS